MDKHQLAYAIYDLCKQNGAVLGTLEFHKDGEWHAVTGRAVKAADTLTSASPALRD